MCGACGVCKCVSVGDMCECVCMRRLCVCVGRYCGVCVGIVVCV
jgi:hypothetical protein